MTSTSRRTLSSFHYTLLALLLLAGAFAAIMLYQFNPVQHSFFPICIFYRVTGLYCPGCGAQRALHALLHGRLLTALHFNPLFVLALPFLFYAGGRYLWRRAMGMPTTPFVVRPFWAVTVAVIVIAFGILRNIPCAPFTYLAPP
jgi:hypothetical protein